MEGKQKHNNGRRHSAVIKHEARQLRKQGWTHREIMKKLGISNGSAHLWTQGIRLTAQQKHAIELRRNRHVFTTEERIKIGKRLALFHHPRHSKQKYLNRIIRFYQKNQRIPLKREFNSHRGYRLYFGSWNNAIKAAGFEPNPELFAKRVIASDGHLCDSFAEKIIDDWLHKHHVEHQRNARYPNSRMTADFHVAFNNTFIEFFGLKGVNRKYDTNFQRKQQIIRKEKLRVISLYPQDLEMLNQKLENFLSNQKSP